MDAVKGWAISICMASLAGTVAHFLSPSGSTQRIFKVVISVFFITVMIYPVLGISTDDIDDVIDSYTYHDSYIDNTEQITDILLKQSVSQVKLAVGEILKGVGIEEYQISVNTDITEDESIVISSINVVIKEEYRSRIQEIHSAIAQSVDCQIDIYIGGNENGETEDGG